MKNTHHTIHLVVQESRFADGRQSVSTLAAFHTKKEAADYLKDFHLRRSAPGRETYCKMGKCTYDEKANVATGSATDVEHGVTIEDTVYLAEAQLYDRAALAKA